MADNRFRRPKGTNIQAIINNSTVVREIFACKTIRLLIFRVLQFSSHEPSETFSTITNIRCRKYFTCLIFVGKAHQQKFFRGKNFPNYGTLVQSFPAVWSNEPSITALRWLAWPDHVRLRCYRPATVTATYHWSGWYHVEEIQRYVNAQQCLQLHWTGLQGQVNRENCSWTSAYTYLYVFSSLVVALLTCHTQNT